MSEFEDNYRLLIIDDMPSIHEDFKKILTPENSKSDQSDNLRSTIFGTTVKKNKLPPFKIDYALQGAEGVIMAKKALEENKPYAVAFVDVQMPPGQDGVETIDQLWSIDPNIQTVICTAYAKYTWEDLQKRFGDTDRLYILKKPFDNLEAIQLAITLTKKWNINYLVQSQLMLVKKMESAKDPIVNQTIGSLKNSLDKLSQLTNTLKRQNIERKILKHR